MHTYPSNLFSVMPQIFSVQRALICLTSMPLLVWHHPVIVFCMTVDYFIWQHYVCIYCPNEFSLWGKNTLCICSLPGFTCLPHETERHKHSTTAPLSGYNTLALRSSNEPFFSALYNCHWADSDTDTDNILDEPYSPSSSKRHINHVRGVNETVIITIFFNPNTVGMAYQLPCPVCYHNCAFAYKCLPSRHKHKHSHISCKVRILNSNISAVQLF